MKIFNSTVCWHHENNHVWISRALCHSILGLFTDMSIGSKSINRESALKGTFVFQQLACRRSPRSGQSQHRSPWHDEWRSRPRRFPELTPRTPTVAMVHKFGFEFGGLSSQSVLEQWWGPFLCILNSFTHWSEIEFPSKHDLPFLRSESCQWSNDGFQC